MDARLGRARLGQPRCPWRPSRRPSHLDGRRRSRPAPPSDSMPQYATQPYGSRGNLPARAAAGGLDVRTLFITACASAGAAYACSKIWAPGTLASAAFTPVIVALIKEALDKPTEVVARAVPVKGVVRSAHLPGEPPPTEIAPTTGAPADAAPSPLADEDPAARVPQPGEIQYHARRRLRGWRLAVVTGLL